MIPKTHPRYASLKQRESLVKGIAKGITHMSGLISHGRGEAFDYLLSEKTHRFALNAINAAAAMIVLSKYPVFSVNGNVAVLVPEHIMELQKKCSIPVEINLFHRTGRRIAAIKKHLEAYGVRVVNGRKNDTVDIRVIDSDRAIVCKSGIYSADTVIVPLEDGDRTQALKSLGKKVISIDLNPMSRTSVCSDITIVDNITRALPLLASRICAFKRKPVAELRRILKRFNNKKNLVAAERAVRAFSRL